MRGVLLFTFVQVLGASRLTWRPPSVGVSRSAFVTMAGRPSKEEDAPKPKKGISFGGLAQLITMGAGAPSLGDFKEWKGNTAMFELEANNLTDENGNVKRGRYLEEGYVDSASEDKAPGFFENLASGGELQRAYTERQAAKRKGR